MSIVITGDKLGHTKEYVKGLNTLTDDQENIYATTCGVVELTDRIISVRNIFSCYIGQIGDVIVGRVREIIGSRWKIHIGSDQDAFMLLSNVTEPGGVLRRRGHEDELQMRNLLAEGDIVVCEVQRIFFDGSISLHTRNGVKYGRMNEGVLVIVQLQLIPRMRKHFYNFSCAPAIHVIIGDNGFIWLSTRGGRETYLDLIRTRNALLILNHERQPIHLSLIEGILAKVKELDMDPWSMHLKENREMFRSLEYVTASEVI